MQDLLDLGSEARMNTPSVGAGNWGWRLQGGELDEAQAERLLPLGGLARACEPEAHEDGGDADDPAGGRHDGTYEYHSGRDPGQPRRPPGDLNVR